MAILDARAGSDAVVKLVFHGHRVLCHDGIGPVGHVAVVPVEAALGALAEIYAELRAGVDEEVHAARLASPGQMGHDGHLHVVDGAAVGLGLPRHAVDDGLVVEGADVLVPSHLGIVQLGGDGGYRGEILLHGVAHGQSASDAALHLLHHFGREADGCHVVSAIEAHGERVAVLAYLGPCAHGQQQQQQGEEGLVHRVRGWRVSRPPTRCARRGCSG